MFEGVKKSIKVAKEQKDAKIIVDPLKEQEAIDIVETGQMLDISSLLAPQRVEIDENWIRVGTDYMAGAYVQVYPHQLQPGWLARYLQFRHPLELSMFIQPIDHGAWVKQARQKVVRSRTMLEKQAQDGAYLDDRRVAFVQDMEEWIALVESDLSRPFYVTLLMMLRASSPEELETRMKELEAVNPNVKLVRTEVRQEAAFNSILPLCRNDIAELDSTRQLQTQAVQALFPFLSSNITHESGVLIGQALPSKEPIILDRFLQPPYGNITNPNMVVFGGTGAGKSYFCKLEALRWSFFGYPIIIVDPSQGGEYTTLAGAVGGQTIRIALDSIDHLNPLDFSWAVGDISHNAVKRKIETFEVLVRLMLRARGDVTNFDALTRRIIANALTETYKQFGYLADDTVSQQKATPERMPTMTDFHTTLTRFRRMHRDPAYQERILPLIAALDDFVGDGHLAGLVDHTTNVSLDNPFIVFHVGDVGDEHMPLVMQLVLEYLRTTLFTTKQASSGLPRLLYIDEAQRLMQFPETARFLDWTVRTTRKYGVGLTCLTQNVAVFVDGAVDERGVTTKVSILANCAMKVLLKQEASELPVVKRYFRLNDGELSALYNAGYGTGLLKVEEESIWFSARGIVNPLENMLLTTSMLERAEHEAMIADHEAEQLGPGDLHDDEDADFFDDLDDDETPDLNALL